MLIQSNMDEFPIDKEISARFGVLTGSFVGAINFAQNIGPLRLIVEIGRINAEQLAVNRVQRLHGTRGGIFAIYSFLHQIYAIIHLAIAPI